MRSATAAALLLGVAALATTALAALDMELPLDHGHSKDYMENLKLKYKDDMLYVHLIPHTHDDVGWLKTVDDYFTGANPLDQVADVRAIITTAMAELLKDPTKRFTYVEMKFFSMWWRLQTEDMKS